MKMKMKMKKQKLLASLILAILFSMTCGDSATDPVKVPAISAEEQYAFTYNEQASFMFPNSGGDVESYKLITGTLPDGLDLAVKDGQLFIEGTPTKVTLNTAKAQIASVPLFIEAVNQSGNSRVSVNVTVNPKLVSGDQSEGIVHDNLMDTDMMSMNGIQHNHKTSIFHTHSDMLGDHSHPVLGYKNTNYNNANNVNGASNHEHIDFMHTHDNASNIANPHLIHNANNISFASGGTGSLTDPVLIGVASDATNLSFVVDVNNWMIPDFDATNNNIAFHIQLIGMPVGTSIDRIQIELIKELTLNEDMQLDFSPSIPKDIPLNLTKGADLLGAFTFGGSSEDDHRFVSTNPLIIRILQRKSGVHVSPLEGAIRITISITPLA